MEKLKVSESFRTAALKSNLKEIRRMVRTYQSKDFGRELAWAVANGLLNVVKCLVEEYANIEYGNGLPLYLAVKLDHISIVKYLIDEDADVNSERIPINYAVEHRKGKMSKYLLQQGAIVYDDDLFIYNRAIEWGNEEIVKLIFSTGTFDQDSKNCALWVAAENGRNNIVKFLIGQGADADSQFAIESAFDERKYWIAKHLTDLVLKEKPFYISEIREYMSERSRVRYAELLTADHLDMF